MSFGIGAYLKKRNLIDTVPTYFYANLVQQIKRADAAVGFYFQSIVLLYCNKLSTIRATRLFGERILLIPK